MTVKVSLMGSQLGTINGSPHSLRVAEKGKYFFTDEQSNDFKRTLEKVSEQLELVNKRYLDLGDAITNAYVTLSTLKENLNEAGYTEPDDLVSPEPQGPADTSQQQ